MTAADGPLGVVQAGGLRFAVRLTPKAGRDGVTGVTRDADGRATLHLKVAAPPVDGAANAALIAYLAKNLRVAKSTIRVASGETGRLKIIEISGDGAELAARLDTWVGRAGVS